MGNADNLGSEAKGEREDNREQTAGKQERVKRRVNNLKGILFFLFIACLLSVAVTTLIPFKRGIAGEYTADVVSLSTQEKTGEAQIRFSGTYTQYLLNMMFGIALRERFMWRGILCLTNTADMLLLILKRRFPRPKPVWCAIITRRITGWNLWE